MRSVYVAHRATATISNYAVEDATQRDQYDRTEDSLGQNVPGDRFVLEFAFENLVPKQERVNTENENDEGGGHGDWLD